jgi:hypothetical protein
VLSLITPENLPDILIGVGAIITAIGGITWWRVRNEPPKPGTADAATLALAENTRATLEMVEWMKRMVASHQNQNDLFAENNEMFKGIGGHVGTMARDFAEMRHDGAESKGHLASIRDALNRKG